jgi:short-subunit dehydrogenase
MAVFRQLFRLFLLIVCIYSYAYELLGVSYPTHTHGIIVVTGASSGIGRDAAFGLAAKSAAHPGASVPVNGVPTRPDDGFVVWAGVRTGEQATELEAAAKEAGLGQRIRPVLLDVTKGTDIATIADEVAASGAPLVAVVNNAGVGSRRPFELEDFADVRGLLNVNVVGAFALTHALLPAIREAQGRVVFVGSIAGEVSSPLNTVYSASKFAVRAFVDSLRREMWHLGVHASVVEPGPVDTSILGKVERGIRQIEWPAHYAPAAQSVDEALDEFRATMEPTGETVDAIVHAVSHRVPHPAYITTAPAKKARWFSLLPSLIQDAYFKYFSIVGKNQRKYVEASAGKTEL